MIVKLPGSLSLTIDRLVSSLAFKAAAILALVAGPAVEAAAQNIIERIEVLVNDEPISAYDINQRLGLVVAATGGVSSQEELLRLRQQVVRSMVDEKLQLQEALDNEVEISEQDVEQAFVRISQNFNQTPEQFERFLGQSGTTKQALLSQVRAEIAWSDLINRRLRPQIAVGDEEVEQVISRLEDSAGQFEYLVSEIFLIVDNPNKAEEVRATADRAVAQLREGTPFQAYARQFSQAATAAVGGDLGWVAEGRLAPVLDEALSSMEVGDISQPIRAAGGFYVLTMRDRRRILSVDPLDVQLSLKQLYHPFTEESTTEEAEAVLNRLEAELDGMVSCDAVAQYAEATGIEQFGDLGGSLRLRDLPREIQNNIRDLPIGKGSAPIASADGIRVLFVCDRTEPEISLPDFDQVALQLEQQRLSMMARRYLRDLRRDAIIDYR